MICFVCASRTYVVYDVVSGFLGGVSCRCRQSFASIDVSATTSYLDYCHGYSVCVCCVALGLGLGRMCTVQLGGGGCWCCGDSYALSTT